MLVFFLLRSPLGRGPELFGTLIGIGMLPAGFYALGCGCVTFASEREDDTHIRAVSMVYPPGLTLLLKMLFGIVTTLAFVALILLSAWLLRGSELEQAPVRFDECVMVVVWVTCLMLTAQSCGVCCSLLTRRVLTAMFAAAHLKVVSHAVTLGTLQHHVLQQAIDRVGDAVGLLLVRLPGERLVLSWRLPSFAESDGTEVDVRFDAVDGGTRVSVEHRGWDDLRPDHPARHGKQGRDYEYMKASLWAENLTALRQRIARGTILNPPADRAGPTARSDT